MPEHTSSDDSLPRADRRQRDPDAHGQAAMLLAESLIHGLLARSVISVRDAIEIAGIASEVKEEVAAEMGDSQSIMNKSLGLLRTIGESLNHDLPGGQD